MIIVIIREKNYDPKKTKIKTIKTRKKIMKQTKKKR